MSIATVADIQETLATALSAGRTLEVVSGGSKRFYGRPVQADDVLSVAELGGIVDYQPQELNCLLRPGTPILELERTLAAENQALAFEPPHWGATATIGGTIGTNLAGPRRFKAGAARDHLLGFQAVTGRGQVVRGGGRVVKNVTGYDLSKLMAGSLGTLGVMTELCIKVLPRAETERTVVLIGQPLPEAIRTLIEASKSPHDVGGLAYLPAGSQMPEAVAGATAVTLLRVEGPEASTRYRAQQLLALARQGEAVELVGAPSAQVWRAVRELTPLLDITAPLPPGLVLWRFSIPPTAAPRLVASLTEADASVPRSLYDWGGGLVWVMLPGRATEQPPHSQPPQSHRPYGTGTAERPNVASADRHGTGAAKHPTAAVHRLAAELGGHARLVKTAADVPQADWLPPQAGARDRLHRNLKQAFDPQGLLNPGRFYPGW